MAPGTMFVGLDIGATTVSFAAASHDAAGQLRVVACDALPSGRALQGRFVDPEGASATLARLLAPVTRSAGPAVLAAALSIPGQQIQPRPCAAEHGWPAARLVEPEMLATLRRRALHEARLGGPVLAWVSRASLLDGREVGERAPATLARHMRVELEAFVAPAWVVDQRARALAPLSIGVNVLLPRAVASAEAAVRPDELAQGVAVIDLGGASTDVAVYLDGRLHDLFSLPAGGDAITRDLAAVLGVPQGVAERLKVRGLRRDALLGGARGGGARRRQADDEIVTLARRTAGARVLDLFARIRQRLEQQDTHWRLLAGAVLVGGGARLEGITPVVHRALGMPVRLGAPLVEGGTGDPAATSAVGLALAQARLCAIEMAAAAPAAEAPPEPVEPVEPAEEGAPPRSGMVPAISRWLREFVPLGDEA